MICWAYTSNNKKASKRQKPAEERKSKRTLRYLFYIEARMESQQTFVLYLMGSCLPTGHFNGRSTSRDDIKSTWNIPYKHRNDGHLRWVEPTNGECCFHWANKQHIKTAPGWIVLMLQGSWYPELLSSWNHQTQNEGTQWYPNSKHYICLPVFLMLHQLPTNRPYNMGDRRRPDWSSLGTSKPPHPQWWREPAGNQPPTDPTKNLLATDSHDVVGYRVFCCANIGQPI